MASVMRLHLVCEREDTLEHANGKCHMCTLYSTRRPLWNINNHLVTLLNIPMLGYQ